MSLEFYHVNDIERKNSLFVLNRYDIINEIEKKTGIIIDLYGTTRLYNSQIKNILNIVNENVNKPFVSFLREMNNQGVTLVVEGD